MGGVLNHDRPSQLWGPHEGSSGINPLKMQEEVRQRKSEPSTVPNDGREADELDSVEQPVSTPGPSRCLASLCRKGEEEDVDSY